MAVLTWLLHDRVPCVGLVVYVISIQNPKHHGSVQATNILTCHRISLSLWSFRRLLLPPIHYFRKARQELP
jgi:hypothetical protein